MFNKKENIKAIEDNMITSVAIVTYGLTKGGAERVISLLANYLDNRGIRVKIFSFTNMYVAYPLNQSVEIVYLTEKKGHQYNNRDILDRMCKLRRYISKDRPDITLVMPEEMSAIVVPTLLGTRTKLIVSERNNPHLMPQNKLKRKLRSIFYRFADGFVFQTQEAKDYFSLDIQKKSSVIANPISSDLVNVIRSEDIKNEIVAVGRLDPQKNFNLLLDAFEIFNRRFPEFILKIYGEGDQRSILEQRVKDKCLIGKVFLPGKKDDIFNEIKDASLFVLSSDFEGMPNALMEAMAIGLPVISTDCSCGPKELIKNNYNGVLVPVNNAQAMADAMSYVISNPEVRKELGYNARNIIDELNPEKILNQWVTYFQEVYQKK